MDKKELVRLDLPQLYRSMYRIRRTEKALAERYADQEMRCPLHLCIGQEAIATGICSALKREDSVMGNHRSHGHYLAKGGDLDALIAEIYGKATGCCGGRGGSMHLIDHQAGFMGAAPIVGGTIPLAVGLGWANRLNHSDHVAVVFFGDGCFEEGVLHESMNLACLKKIPVLFVCENNGLAVYTGLDERQPDRTIAQVARGHGINTFEGDGNNVLEVRQLADKAIALARRGAGPQFLELDTNRWMAHVGWQEDDHLNYRSHEPALLRRKNCPLKKARALLKTEMMWTDKQFKAIEHAANQEIDLAFDKALKAPTPEPSTACHHLYKKTEQPPSSILDSVSSERRLPYSTALQEAMRQAMERDDRVMVIGEGVPDPMAIFRTTEGLQETFGAERVQDMPLAENGLTGACIGLALSGWRPIMTHQRIDFVLLALDQIINNAAKWFYMFDGQASVPIVIRLLIGRGWGQGPQHAQSLQALFGHIPGLKVVMPTTARDAKGMLLAAVDDPNPVIIIEHRWLYHLKGVVSEQPEPTPLEGAHVARSGTDITIAAFSHMTVDALWAAQILTEHGIEAEVIDMRAIRPLDSATVVKSVHTTGRLLVADTGWSTYGVSGELIARVCETGFSALKQPPRRVTLPDYPSPTAQSLTDDYFPDAETLIRAVLEMVDPEQHHSHEEIALKGHRPAPRDIPNREFNSPF
ncbi:MAG: dehydrogenase [Magnetococcales bacterium]|nr:dehydrogenase [Magnetococcales bacterium]